jgi:hypothetical protein
VKQALRQPLQEAPAPARKAPSTITPSATVIQLSARPTGRGLDRSGTVAPAPVPQPSRRGSGGSDLLFGGILALILLIACVTWEYLSRPAEMPHAALNGSSAFTPTR